jgi:outer membrane protein assembly factor BamB
MSASIARRIVLSLVSAAGLALLVASSAFATDWPQSRFGPEANGLNGSESTLNSSNLSQLALSWRTTVSAPPNVAPVSSPVIAGGMVYVGSNDGRLYALNASTGAIAWYGSAGASIPLPPAVEGTRIFAGSDDGKVYAFPTSCSTPCAPLWTTTTSGRISSAPIVSNGVVYVGAGNGAEGDLWALNAGSGAVVWSAHLSGAPVGVAVENGVVYASDGSSLFAFPTSCSTPCSYLWLGQSAGAPPAVGSGEVFSDAGFVNDRFNVFPATASCATPCPPLWTGHTNSGSRRPVAVANGMVFLPEGDGTLAAFPTQCATLCLPSWSVPLGGFVSAPSVANGVVYVGTDGDVKTFDASNGTPLPSIATGSTTLSPAIANGVVYVSTFDFTHGGTVSAYALNATDTQPPTLHLPGNITVVAGDSSGAVVTYNVTADDAIDPSPSVNCTPPSGSTFPIGTTQVNCVASDASGNTASGSFNVSVLAPWDITLTLAGKDNVNPKTGVVTATGTIQCNRDGGTSIFGTLSQQVAGRATLTANFFIFVSCTAPSSSWTATVSANNGKILAGKATLSASAFGCELTCDSSDATATVTLRAMT